MKSDLLVIIPAYNEEENIENVVSFIQKKYSKYDYIVVMMGRETIQQIFVEKRI